jgi:hypothetical protein
VLKWWYALTLEDPLNVWTFPNTTSSTCTGKRKDEFLNLLSGADQSKTAKGQAKTLTSQFQADIELLTTRSMEDVADYHQYHEDWAVNQSDAISAAVVDIMGVLADPGLLTFNIDLYFARFGLPDLLGPLVGPTSKVGATLTSTFRDLNASYAGLQTFGASINKNMRQLAVDAQVQKNTMEGYFKETKTIFQIIKAYVPLTHSTTQHHTAPHSVTLY